ncbi:MAG TPA: hypothetical protein GXZ27_11585, partial [Thermoanaerobacterales bacterium]|nr:hypothetical protein [Thermoanaerobacterales bacterium]
MGRTVKEYISDLFLGIGFILIISPSVLFWFIHGSYERYIWIINGPYPFGHFGGGPFQLFMYLGLFIVGIILIVISLVLKAR